MADQYHHGNLKSKLLEEAVTLISQDGLENLSLRRLATQCGVSHNAIYRHFDSKERLIDACRAYVMQELTRTLELTLSGLDESLPQTMEQLGTAYLDFYMRNPTVKAEIQMRNFEASIPVGFFCYPISQAADITAFNATAVPVGEDQEPMLEQCREIVHKFNTVYGETLTMPQIVLPSNNACMRLPGTDGKAKMSKSLGNCIYLADPEEVVREKIMSMYTDPDHIRVQDPGKLEGNTVFTYLDAFCQPEHFAEFLPDYQSLDELKAHYQRGGLGDVKVKKFLNNVMQSLLSPMRERRAQWEGRLPEVYEILKKGSEIAAETAQGTLDRVRHAMKIDYFTDNGLLK